MPRNKKGRIRTPPVTAVLNAAELSSGCLAFPSGECQHKRLQALRPRLTPGLPKFSVLRGCSRLLVLSYTVRDAKGVIRWRGADFFRLAARPFHWHYFTKFGLVHASVQMDTKTEFASVSIQNQPFLVEIAQYNPPKVCALHQQKVTNLCLLTRAKQTRVG